MFLSIGRFDAATNGSVGIGDNALAVPGVEGKIDDSHHGGAFVRSEDSSPKFELCDPRFQCIVMFPDHISEGFEAQHGATMPGNRGVARSGICVVPRYP